ncbi:phosphoribosylamine/glycine ligase [Oscillochloris trichoides DG-6]|uniref:Phosphoribosylamine--glycine ligase n=1 Tax=Oscillochloris trichoides DG-6 TaxID=765420 RepID=E1IGU1_9CHLR|nr:phosphoribosylamine--glycine ligase [Oscillochloris trichoides]EFO79416.1 phosphoribosylamine/glycine ligase [Oscillochloris trichoides DG-6]
MNVLLIGSGGREHALAWKIAQSPQLGKLLCVPGNTGTARHGHNVPFPLHDFDALIDVAQREKIDLVVVGPENPLSEGIADRFNAAGIPVFGPTAAAARIESSKAFAKEIMAEAGVPTAATHVFTTPSAAAEFVRTSGSAWVVKVDGLAQGKGVVVPDTVEETLAAIEQLNHDLPEQALLLEERLIGREVSVLALCDGSRLMVLPPARDHKRVGDGDVGPNTGGMGVIAPVDDVSSGQLEMIIQTCLQPTINTLAARGTPFRGVLYAGLMLTETGPRVLEYNARFGDPETQALLPLIEGDLLEALYGCATGNLQVEKLRRRKGYAVCVVLCAAGYPERPRKGDVIRGVEAVDDDKVIIFHAGTALGPNGLCTAGGRVLGVTGLGSTLRQARERAYECAAGIRFDGKHYRSDIGKEG